MRTSSNIFFLNVSSQKQFYCDSRIIGIFMSNPPQAVKIASKPPQLSGKHTSQHTTHQNTIINQNKSSMCNTQVQPNAEHICTLKRFVGRILKIKVSDTVCSCLTHNELVEYTTCLLNSAYLCISIINVWFVVDCQRRCCAACLLISE